MVETTAVAKRRLRLKQLQNVIRNPQQAAAIRQQLAQKPSTFDAVRYTAFVTDHPVFSRLHLYSDDE